MNDYQPLSVEEERRLIRRAQGKGASASRAKAYLVTNNLRLIYRIAQSIETRHLDLEDLMHEGIQGLLCALERFDLTRGVRFSTYSVWWIRQAMRLAHNNTDTLIRLPSKVHDLLVWEAKEIARTGSSEGFRRRLSADARRTLDLAHAAIEVRSLDEPVSRRVDESTTRGELQADRSAQSYPEIAYIKGQISEGLKTILWVELTQRELWIVTKRFGFDGNEPWTLSEIGDALGLSRERIRQIETQVLRRLSKVPHAREILKLAEKFE